MKAIREWLAIEPEVHGTEPVTMNQQDRDERIALVTQKVDIALERIDQAQQLQEARGRHSERDRAAS